jgi:sulfate adenylyltransferase subunit 1
MTMTVLRLATAGSVDDGKSTLVGRLLHDTRSVPEDQLAGVRRASRQVGLDGVDLALLTDGLRAEREQGITIDVAYRYFATETRTFILADCPGHVQYTRNAVTGASTADAVVVLLDARHGVVEQTRRHLAVAALLGVAHTVVAVNKIDLVGYSATAARTVADQVHAVASDVGLAGVHTVPISALHGDNVVHRSARTPWYDGPSLLELLDGLPPSDAAQRAPLRMPVQLVIRPRQAAARPDLYDYRGYAGRVLSGTISAGDPVAVLPSGRTSTVVGLDLGDRRLNTATAGQSVTVRLADQLDISRGDLLAAADSPPQPVHDLDATVCWLAQQPLHPGQRLLVKHGTRTLACLVQQISSRLDVTDLCEVPAQRLELNDLGRLRLRLAEPVPAEPYAVNRATGAFLLLDPDHGATLAAGMVDAGGADLVRPPAGRAG